MAALGRERLSHKGEAFRRLRLGTGVIAVAVLVLNLLGGYVRGRLDLTDGRLFTLSQGSRDLLGGLDDIVNLTFFVSDDLPQEIQIIVRDVRDLVADLENASGGMLATREVNPDDGEDAAEEASWLGIMPINFNVIGDDEFQVKQGYFGLALTYADELEAIPVIRRADDLEFRLVSAIARMTTEERPSLAFLTGFGASEPHELQRLQESVAARFDVTSINMETDSAATLNADSIDVLVVAGPEQVPPEVADRIDAYLDAGGAALLLLERHTFYDPNAPVLMPVTTGLEDLLAARGVKSTGEIVFDVASFERLSLQRGIFTVMQPYPFWPVATRGRGPRHHQRSREHRIGMGIAFHLGRRRSLGHPAVDHHRERRHAACRFSHSSGHRARAQRGRPGGPYHRRRGGSDGCGPGTRTARASGPEDESSLWATSTFSRRTGCGATPRAWSSWPTRWTGWLRTKP